MMTSIELRSSQTLSKFVTLAHEGRRPQTDEPQSLKVRQTRSSASAGIFAAHHLQFGSFSHEDHCICADCPVGPYNYCGPGLSRMGQSQSRPRWHAGSERSRTTGTWVIAFLLTRPHGHQPRAPASRSVSCIAQCWREPGQRSRRGPRQDELRIEATVQRFSPKRTRQVIPNHAAISKRTSQRKLTVKTQNPRNWRGPEPCIQVSHQGAAHRSAVDRP